MGLILPPEASIYFHKMTAKELGISEDEYKIQDALGLISSVIGVDWGISDNGHDFTT
jgi:hypothetical protein